MIPRFVVASLARARTTVKTISDCADTAASFVRLLLTDKVTGLSMQYCQQWQDVHLFFDKTARVTYDFEMGAVGK
jgi:hypothetical protein